MKKVVLLVLALVLCIGLCSTLSGYFLFRCASWGDPSYNREERIDTVKAEFRAVMESLNAKIAFGDFSPEIDSDTTIQQVVDMVRNQGGGFFVYNINTEKRFLDYCELSPIGLYIIKDDARWLELYFGL